MQFVYGIYCSIYSGCASGKGYKNIREGFVIITILAVKLKFEGEKLGAESFWCCKISVVKYSTPTFIFESSPKLSGLRAIANLRKICQFLS